MDGVMEKVADHRRQSWLQFVAGVAVMFVVGCGGGEEIVNPVTEMTDDQKQVNSLVGSVSDLAGANLKQLRSAFTKEDAPSSGDLKKFKSHYVNLDGDITVSGDSASIPVAVGKYGSEDTKTATWKAVKVDGSWKMSEAPIP